MKTKKNLAIFILALIVCQAMAPWTNTAFATLGEVITGPDYYPPYQHGRIYVHNPDFGPTPERASEMAQLFINTFGWHTILNREAGRVVIGMVDLDDLNNDTLPAKLTVIGDSWFDGSGFFKGSGGAFTDNVSSIINLFGGGYGGFEDWYQGNRGFKFQQYWTGVGGLDGYFLFNGRAYPPPSTPDDPDFWQGKYGRMSGILFDDLGKISFLVSPTESPGDEIQVTPIKVMTITKDGYVGIGTTNPTENLDVATKVRIRDLPPTTNITRVVLADPSGVLQSIDLSRFLRDTFYSDNDWCVSGDNVYTGTAAPYPIGNVGIGTDTPRNKFEVKADGERQVRVWGPGSAAEASIMMGVSDSNKAPCLGLLGVGSSINSIPDRRNNVFLEAIGGVIDEPCCGIVFRTCGRTRMIITADGIGINTTSPAEKLDVAGTAQMTGFKMPTGAVNNYVLTSNASGVGTWKPAPMSLPSGTSGQTLRHDGTSWAANSVIFNNGTNIGVGTSSPAQKMDVAGTVQMTGFKMPTGASNNYVLTSDGSGNGTWKNLPSSAPGITGSGTANYIAKFTGSTSIGNSAIYETGGNIGVSTSNPTEKLHVNGKVRIDGSAQQPGTGLLTPLNGSRAGLQSLNVYKWVKIVVDGEELYFPAFKPSTTVVTDTE